MLCIEWSHGQFTQEDNTGLLYSWCFGLDYHRLLSTSLPAHTRQGSLRNCWRLQSSNCSLLVTQFRFLSIRIVQCSGFNELFSTGGLSQ